MPSAIRNPNSDFRTSFWLAIWSLASRELVRFFRQRTRVIGGARAAGAVLGSVRSRPARQFQAARLGPREMTYQEYFFPGVAVLIVMFTAIFSTISIIEDRREGFLQGVLVAPDQPAGDRPRQSSAAARRLAVLQAGLFLALAPFLGLSLTPADGRRSGACSSRCWPSP